jgi:signal transduction histidine kinase
MFRTIRSRLWLTYAVLITVLLSVFFIGLLVALGRSPFFYRQAITRIRVAGTAVATRLDALLVQNPERISRLISREADNRQMRFVLLTTKGKTEVDSSPGDLLPILKPPIQGEGELDSLAINTYKDKSGKVWLYNLTQVNSNYVLLTVIPRPRILLRNIVLDDVIGPVFRIGILALVLAILFSWGMTRWVSKPLQHMSAVARSVEAGQYQEMPLEGPQEVKQLGSALNEMMHRLSASQQSQRDFVANVSHELKTPLTSIQGFSQAILDGAAHSPEEIRQAAEIIYNESARLHRLTMDLLSLARLEAGTADMQMVNFNLKQMLGRIVEKLNPQAKKGEVTLKINVIDNLSIEGDIDCLEQVFTNLIDNGINFTPSDSQVVVNGVLSEKFLILHVIDNGPGIDPSQRNRVFERFYQVDQARRGGTQRGTGLGLAIARQIILAHHGEIWVEGESGQGADFVVKLPILQSSNLNKRLPEKGV